MKRITRVKRNAFKLLHLIIGASHSAGMLCTMKEWLKHKYGFINVDDDNVYVTKTGNWSEINGLKEKNYKPLKFADLRTKLKVGIYLILMVGMILIGFVSNILSGNISILLIFGLPALGYTAFQYIIPEFGSSFVIPKNKITEIRTEESDVYIDFLDANDKSTSNHFRNLNQRGLETINRVKNATNQLKVTGLSLRNVSNN